MKFHLEFEIKKLSPSITHKEKLLLTGSCFTENIGEKLKKYKFSILENPNGILFNPVSIAQSLESYIDNKQITRADLFQLNEGWHSWQHHSRFSGINAGEVVNKINHSTSDAHNYLRHANYLMITLGSAWIYTLTEKVFNSKNNFVVANNHKAPAHWFCRTLLTNEEVVQVLENVLHGLFLFNQKLRIIFTISPVRHLREGVIENNRSKAVLIQAVHHLVDKFDELYYFPAYELVIDDLRDYRFYAEDLVHPNYFATQYVWEKFVDVCMDGKTKTLMQEIHEINLAHQHKAFNPSSEQHKNFLRTFYEKTTILQNQHPYLNLKNELEYFSSFH